MILGRLRNLFPSTPEPEETSDSNESLAARFHRRKLEARRKAAQPSDPKPPAPTAPQADREPPPKPLTDADMPPVESLHFDSDFTGFLSPEVSEDLRRLALRKLFHSPALNVVDGLDEYADDFTKFEPLGNLITADMRHQMERMAEQEKEAAGQALAEEDETDRSLPALQEGTQDPVDDPESAEAGSPAPSDECEEEKPLDKVERHEHTSGPGTQ